MIEWNDVYDSERNLIGARKRRDDRWMANEYRLVVCVWVYNRKGEILLTKRAPEKSFAGTWENSGGMARAGEDSLTGIQRELREETGIDKEKDEFLLIRRVTESGFHYDHYAVLADIPKEDVILQPGETCDVQWASPEKIHKLIEKKQMCKVIGEQFLIEEERLRELMKEAKM